MPDGGSGDLERDRAVDSSTLATEPFPSRIGASVSEENVRC
jgi:hypothetical protein